MKKALSTLLALAITASMIPGTLAASTEATDAANNLHSLGLFDGTGTDANGNPIYDLDRTPTRHEAITMLVRLLGAEDEALAGTWETPFTDVVEWAQPYVGYAYANGLTTGTSDTTFGGTLEINASQYLTFVLRALGYEEGPDFQWDKAWELTDKIGATDGRYNVGNNTFLRGDIAIISDDALNVACKNGDKTLLETLSVMEAKPEQLVDGENSREWISDNFTFKDNVKYTNIQFYIQNSSTPACATIPQGATVTLGDNACMLIWSGGKLTVNGELRGSDLYPSISTNRNGLWYNQTEPGDGVIEGTGNLHGLLNSKLYTTFEWSWDGSSWVPSQVRATTYEALKQALEDGVYRVEIPEGITIDIPAGEHMEAARYTRLRVFGGFTGETSATGIFNTTCDIEYKWNQSGWIPTESHVLSGEELHEAINLNIPFIVCGHNYTGFGSTIDTKNVTIDNLEIPKNVEIQIYTNLIVTNSLTVNGTITGYFNDEGKLTINPNATVAGENAAKFEAGNTYSFDKGEWPS